MDNWEVEIVPLPLFLLVRGLIALDCLDGKLPSDTVVMMAALTFFGLTCGEFDKRLSMLGELDAAAVYATSIPSALVHYGLLPGVIVESTTKFYKSTNILYLYICYIIVDSVMNMGRTALIWGFLKIFSPMLCGEVAGILVDIGVSTLLGMEPFQVFFFIVLPVTAGGMGKRAIPLLMGYAALTYMEQGVVLDRTLPVVILGSLTVIIISDCLNQLGRRSPYLTGEGQLMPNHGSETHSLGKSGDVSGKTDVGTLASGTLLAVLLYMMGVLGHKLIGLPALVGMLFLAALLELADVVSPRLQEGSQMVYKFFRTTVTYPILFTVGMAITPWRELVNAFALTNLLVIVSTISVLVTIEFFVSKKIGIHPIDVAIVSCCQSEQSSTGDVATLTAGNRMSLMPFVQTATRIGGAINVSLGLLFLSHYLA